MADFGSHNGYNLGRSNPLENSVDTSGAPSGVIHEPSGLSLARTRSMDRGYVPVLWWIALLASLISVGFTYGDVLSVTNLLAYEDASPSLIRGISGAVGMTVLLTVFAFLILKRPRIWTRLHVVVGATALCWGGSALLGGLRFFQWILPNQLAASIWQSGKWLGLAVFPLFFTLVLVLPVVILPRLLPAYVHKSSMVRFAATMLSIGIFFPFETVLLGSSIEEVFWLAPFWLFMIGGVLLFPTLLGLTLARPGMAPPSIGRSFAGLVLATLTWTAIFSAGGMAQGPYGLWMVLGPIALVLYIVFARGRDELFPIEMAELERFVVPGGITAAEYDFLVDDELYGEFIARARSQDAKSEAVEYLLAARGLASLPRELSSDAPEVLERSREYLGGRLVRARGRLRERGVALLTARPIHRKHWHSP
ncbi:hypothetical protein VR010_02100 [Actinomycetaceae bacterium L2_0104]